jgi:site-specific DNA-methyltransferase (adenine-specific)
MRDSEILAMADFVKGLAAENCALFLWSTCPRLDFAVDVLKAWGFRYATVVFHWVKTNRLGEPIYGPGHYTGSNLEVVLLGIKGKMTPIHRLVPSTILHPRLRHSEKPRIIHKRIERMYGDIPRIELFARHKVVGWDAWGAEVGALDEETLSLG